MTLQVRIASPCSEKWELMVGDERTRACARCKLNVFNVKELSEVEVRGLFVKAEGGRVCGRIYRRPDGTVLTRDCPTGLTAVRRKVLVGVVMAVTLVLSMVGYRARQCAVPSGASEEGWFERTVGRRVVEAREALRSTRTFGPLIEELFPSQMLVGELMALPPPSGAGDPQ